MTKPTVFISYSHLDQEWKERLLPHLRAFEQQGDLILWHDRKIDTGAQWYLEIEAALNKARVAVCLISEHFLASDFISKEEVPALLKRREEEGMHLLPLWVSPCPCQRIRWLKGLQLFPAGGSSLAEIRGKSKQNALLAEFACQVQDHAVPAVVDMLLGALSAQRGGPAVAASCRVEITHLPETGAALLGRERELELLDTLWEQGTTNVLSLVAWGGVGKSTLVNHWLRQMAADHYRGALRVYGWSFYSQGTNEQVTSADQFIAQALTWFGDPDPVQGSPWERGQRLAGLIREQQTLLVLDGMEPLQAGHDFEKGQIKDPSLATLIAELARENPGICLISTREPVADLRRFPATTRELDLEQISAGAGRALLRMGGVRGTDQELEETSRAFGNQALALRLLAAYLHELPGHPVAQAAGIPELSLPEAQGRHPRRVMAAMAERLGDSPEVEYLRILGLFDRPATREALAALLTPPAIPGLTARLLAEPPGSRHQCLARLRRWGLVAPESRHRPGELDCHPLVREHFGPALQTQAPAAWQEGNSRLYQHYRELAPDLPATITEMAPLFSACTHGCRAGCYLETLYEVYWRRISRGEEAYSVHKLGAFGADLAVQANFFVRLWEQPAPELPESAHAVLLGWAGFRLRALGRLTEAIGPMQIGLEMRIRQEDWKNAAKAASNFSELLLCLGEVGQAIAYGARSMQLADASGDWRRHVNAYTTHGDALHQAGRLTEAEALFRQAEKTQQEQGHGYDYLYSVRGYRYCDLLLTLARPAKARERAVTSLKIAQENHWLLDIGLDHLTLGRACHQLDDLHPAATHLDQAVDHLRQAGCQDDLPRGLLARAAFRRDQGHLHAAQRDLDEAMEMAERSGMRLYLTDGHLESCRLLLTAPAYTPAAAGLPNWWRLSARDHMERAQALITECGYHRRAPEAAALAARLAAASAPPTT